MGEWESTIRMLHLRPEDLTEIDQDLLRDLNRETLETLAWQAVELARDLSNRLGQKSSNSSRPPSSDPPWRRSADRQKAKGSGGEDKDGSAGAADRDRRSQVGPRNRQPSRRASGPASPAPGEPSRSRRRASSIMIREPARNAGQRWMPAIASARTVPITSTTSTAAGRRFGSPA